MASAAASGLLTSLLLLLLLRPAPMAAHSVPLPAAFLEDVAGSGEAEGSSASSSSLPPPWTPALSPTPAEPQPTPPVGPPPPTNLLDGLVDFFRQYVMLIAVVGSLALLLMFIVCAALITRQKHKASAYYPSSFPKKKYVDQSDRAGGPQAFSEVPDRAPASRPEEALDSSRQLQADILAATQTLKSPARAAPGSDAARMLEGRAEGKETGSQEVDPDAQGRGGPEEAPEALGEACSAGAEGACVAGGGKGGLPGSPSPPPARGQSLGFITHNGLCLTQWGWALPFSAQPGLPRRSGESKMNACVLCGSDQMHLMRTEGEILDVDQPFISRPDSLGGSEEMLVEGSARLRCTRVVVPSRLLPRERSRAAAWAAWSLRCGGSSAEPDLSSVALEASQCLKGRREASARPPLKAGSRMKSGVQAGRGGVGHPLCACPRGGRDPGGSGNPLGSQTFHPCDSLPS
ncbi:transmembrane protein 119 [Carlito syrichta]|uniref:Transmembrane protein 119 n=1 Tax=Carlito syrichta TaxID=1868482 RepID=A0A3Q0DUY5_CARSF|nr:transmembrane protein 119 [Carlito syrichta]